MPGDDVVTVLREAEELRRLAASVRASGRPLVLVPTMGDLHRGHLSLVELAGRLGPVVVSIFVNPTQFAPNEDFRSYPRDLEADRQRLRGLPVAAVFAPEVDLLYPADADTWVEVPKLSSGLCGPHREGHFRGVATVVAKLLSLSACDVAVFGEKDAQQCLVLRRMVRDLHLPVELVFGPTVREDDGLAMSSRNRYLDASQRRAAGALSAALREGRRLLEGGERSRVVIEEAVSRSAGATLRLDYAELRTVPRLERPERAGGRVLLAAAGRLGRARLIDNLVLQVDDAGTRAAALLDEHTVEAVAGRLRDGGFDIGEATDAG